MDRGNAKGRNSPPHNRRRLNPSGSKRLTARSDGSEGRHDRPTGRPVESALRPVVVVVYQTSQVGDALALPGPDRLLDVVEHEGGAHRGRAVVRGSPARAGRRPGDRTAVTAEDSRSGRSACWTRTPTATPTTSTGPCSSSSSAGSSHTAQVPAPLLALVARQRRQRGRPHGAERLVLPAAAPSHRRQRPQRPRPRPRPPRRRPRHGESIAAATQSVARWRSRPRVGGHHICRARRNYEKWRTRACTMTKRIQQQGPLRWVWRRGCRDERVLAIGRHHDDIGAALSVVRAIVGA
jgi:hypothetical protein